jgi:hypothetical protein
MTQARSHPAQTPTHPKALIRAIFPFVTMYGGQTLSFILNNTASQIEQDFAKITAFCEKSKKRYN